MAARVALDTAGVLAQALAWEGHRDYGQARRLLEGLADHPEVGARARFEVARLALDRERVNFVGAARAFEALAAEGGPRAVEAASEAARAWGRAGELDRAVAGYEALAAAHPDDPKAGSARFFAGFLRYEAGDYPAAVRAWTEARGRLGGFEDAARWYVAWSKYLAGDPAAGAALRALANPEGDRAERRAAYWAVRALGSQDPAGAAALAVRLVSHEPLGWYALLLRRRYPEIFPAPLSPPPSPDPNAQVPGLQRARALQAVGLPWLARLALAAEVPALRRAGESAALRAA
ncbi:MAG: hypothetical protein KC613_24855, partial [Myxococcales bacterium]|nr:hypothetical protein [Myxococcales bacterium]